MYLYSAHRAVIFAIAQLSCLYIFLAKSARLSWPHSAFESTLNSSIVSLDDFIQKNLVLTLISPKWEILPKSLADLLAGSANSGPNLLKFVNLRSGYASETNSVGVSHERQMAPVGRRACRYPVSSQNVEFIYCSLHATQLRRDKRTIKWRQQNILVEMCTVRRTQHIIRVNKKAVLSQGIRAMPL